MRPMRRTTHNWIDLMILNPVVARNLRQISLFRRARNALERKSVHQKVDMTMSVGDWQRVMMRAAQQQKSYDQAASIGGVGSLVRSKLPLRVRGIKQRVRVPSDARDPDRSTRPSERCQRAPSILMSSRTLQLLGYVRKPTLAQQKRLQLLVPISFKRAPQ